MDDVGAAILVAQTLVRGAGVKDQRARGARGVGERENLCGREIDDEKAHAVGEHLLQGRGRIIAWGELGVGDRKGLVEEAAGGVVVVHRHARAGDEVIRRRNIEDRNRIAGMRLMDDADLDGERVRLGGLARGREHRKSRRAKKGAKRLPGVAARGKAGRGLRLLVGAKSEHSAGRILFH